MRFDYDDSVNRVDLDDRFDIQFGMHTARTDEVPPLRIFQKRLAKAVRYSSKFRYKRANMSELSCNDNTNQAAKVRQQHLLKFLNMRFFEDIVVAHRMVLNLAH
jgi:hypothetical protein